MSINIHLKILCMIEVDYPRSQGLNPLAREEGSPSIVCILLPGEVEVDTTDDLLLLPFEG